MFIPFPLILRSNFPRREVYYMADIKTRDAVKGTIKTIDKAAVAGQRMKQAYISTKDKAEHSTSAAENSADEYAADRFERGVDTAVHEGAHQFDKAGRKGVESTKENIHKAKDGIENFKAKRAENPAAARLRSAGRGRRRCCPRPPVRPGRCPAGYTPPPCRCAWSIRW